jgi:hypothetical protein
MDKRDQGPTGSGRSTTQITFGSLSYIDTLFRLKLYRIISCSVDDHSLELTLALFVNVALHAV